jgi:hypothetical protein
LHGDQSGRNAGCLTLGFGKTWLAGLYSSQRHDARENSVGGDEKDFLQFRRARAKIFFSFRAQASGSMRLYQDTHLSNMSESKFRSKMQQAKHA